MPNKLVGLHDAEREARLNSNNKKLRTKFPNLALMKLSTYHKLQGDTVEWWEYGGIQGNRYDVVYSSKVFTFTPETPLLPENTVKGGTGYGLYTELPTEVEACTPDYSLYPECDYALGFLTRGCIRACPFCVVPHKEGFIRPYRCWQDLVRPDTQKLVLMDNNILGCEYGISQLEELASTDYEVDCNQGLDARLVDERIADVLARTKWLQKNKGAARYIRFSCDSKTQLPAIQRTAELLSARGIKPYRLFIYLLVDDLADAEYRVQELKKLKGITLFAQSFRPLDGSEPSPEQQRFAVYVNGFTYKKWTWAEYCEWHGLRPGGTYKNRNYKERA